MWKEDKARAELPRLARLKSGERLVVFEQEVQHEGDRDLPAAEGMRLAYVALTRARARLYVFDAMGARQERYGPTGHLLHDDGGQARLEVHPHAMVIPFDQAVSRLREQPVPTPVIPVLAPAIVQVPAERLQSWSVSSYTQLTSDALRFLVSDEPGPVDDPEARAVLGDEARADQLPAGAHTGNALHLLFERLDFTRAGEASYRDVMVREVLTSFALPRAGASESELTTASALVTRMVERTLLESLPGESWRLADVGVEHTLREWRFHLPTRELSVERMAAAFRASGAEWLAAYADRLRGVPARSVTGFLTGVVDLVAQAPTGRWWIVDWKSNTLGPTAASYLEDGCRDEMLSAHYVLQYHLYAVALHRFLRSRLRDAYDYERDFGGVGYAFLRGLAMGTPAWFVDRPSARLIADLDAAVGQ
jgi:exodeoxyribonuclease V beta subunit